MVGGRRVTTLVPEILGQTDPVPDNADFQSIFARRTSAVTPSETCSVITIRSYKRRKMTL